MIMDVIIPALNEEDAIQKVIHDIPRSIVRNVVVVDNASSDRTAALAKEAGAEVLRESNRGYGAACLLGISYLNSLDERPDHVAFVDGDYSDYPEDLIELYDLLKKGKHDLVLGERVSLAQRNSLTPQQRVGNFIATKMLRLVYGYSFKDLGPMRIVSFKALDEMKMTDRNYGWTVEMQIKAAKNKMSTGEIPVRYRERIGQSKVSGTLNGSVRAGYKIIYTLLRYM